MEVGDLVRNLNSESRMTGVVVDWAVCHDHTWPAYPVVLWSDGRGGDIEPDMVEKVEAKES